MLRNIFFLVAISYAVAQVQVICHSNLQQLTEDQVVTQLFDLCDRNDDGNITESEIVVGFAEILDASLPLSESQILAMDYNALIGLAGLFGFSIDRGDFVRQWHARFHDSHDFIEAIFDVFDDNNNGEWSFAEIDGILNHLLESVAH